WPNLSDVALALRDVYGAEADRLVWFAGDRPHPALAGALVAAAGAAERALEPADFDAERLDSEWKRLQGPSAVAGADRALFDLAVSAAVLREIGAVHHGRVDPHTIGWGYDVGPKKFDRAALLLEARDGGGVPALLDRLEPSYPHYVRNRKQLARYRALAQAGEPSRVPDLPKGRRKVEPGRAWQGLEAVRARLVVLGDLAADAPQASAPDGTPVYEGALLDAVRRFQGRHVLDTDGILGAGTIAALNVPLAARVRQLELAMERGRWLPPVDKHPTVFVNIPLFRLWASDPGSGTEPVRMKVVVGKSLENRTPVFVQYMEYVIFHPYWNPPPSIVSNEIVPHARLDPSYLEREDFEIVASGGEDAEDLPATPENLDAVAAGSLFVRQRPGPRNSLGLAKFIFPNHQNVYMHGTPASRLFLRTRRDFSHGCIRVEDPTRLAEWVLRDVPGWTRQRIEEAMQGERPTRANLSRPLMVVLFYDTVHVNSEEVVHFATDIYGHDKELDQALARGYPYPESAGSGGSRGRP
ncbi:MAG TPA: L,D-transpeptidase family protein, partial [Vicinamibacteria bacterium]|nr:L,D-transpeptidase family protein [Vicinamibacteria bacterium]